MKYFFFILLFSLQISAQLNLNIHTDSPEYSYGEKIRIICTVENNSDSTVTFYASNYKSCQAEFILNDVDSYEWGTCLPTVEELIFPPYSNIQYSWTIDPYVFGLPDKDGTQKLIGYFQPGWNSFDVSHLKDTTTFYAPMFLGGQLIISYDSENKVEIDSIKIQYDVEVVKSSLLNDTYTETWQLIGMKLAEYKTLFKNTGLFWYVDYNRNILYDRIFTQQSPAQFYPLQIGNKWLYKNSLYEVGTEPTITYFSKEVIGDTLMENGKNYFVIKEWGNIYYERFDSTTNEIIRYMDWQCGKLDNPIYNLNYIPNDTLEWWYCDSLGNPYQVFYDESLGPDSSFIELTRDDLLSEEISFRKHLGLFYKSIGEISLSTTVLIGAEINGKVWGTLTSVDENEELIYEFSLHQNYPNPFNPSTTIKFTVGTPPRPSPYQGEGEREGLVLLRIYDILGREIKTLLNKQMQPGTHEVTFDASNLPSGVYFYRLTSGNNSQTKKMLLMR